MSSLLITTFINKEIKLESVDEELLKLLNQSETKYIIRPKNFKELESKIKSLFKPKNKIKSVLSYNGLYSTGKIEEIPDNSSLDENISFILICYKKKTKKIIVPKVDTNNLIKTEDSKIELKLSENIDLDTTFNINQFLKMKEALSSEIITKQDTLFERCIENLNTSLEDELRRSASDFLNNSQKNIKEYSEKLKNSVYSSTKNLIERKNDALNKLNKNAEDIEKINEEIKKNKSNKQIKPIIKKVEPKPEPEEKILFRFNKGLINLEQEINRKDTKKSLKIENIHIKNISKKEYNSALMAWIKEDNSDKQINFDQEEINEIFPFQNEGNYQSQQDINDLYLNLIVDNPQDETDYKMVVSIINKEKKNVISEKPLEIVVKMKKVVTEEEIKEILNNIKQEIEDCDLFIKDEEIIKIIKDEKGDENNIKKIVKDNFENKKKDKIDEMINKFIQETNFREFLTNDEVEKKILFFKLDEEQIKAWIMSKKPAPEPEPQPVPQPDPIPDDNQEERITKMIEELDNEIYICGVIEEDKLRQGVLECNFDYEKFKEWATNHM